MDINQSNRKLLARSKEKRRLSLKSVFWITLVGPLILFVVASVMMYLRLNGFQNILLEVTHRSLPSMTKAAEIANHANTLSYITQGLSTSSTEASRNIFYQQVEGEIANIEALTRDQIDNAYVSTQLPAIRRELSELNELVMQSLELNKTLQQRIDEVYDANEKAHGLIGLNETGSRFSIEFQAWSISYLETVAIMAQVTTSNRLHQIRQFSEEIEQKLDLLELQATKTPEESRDAAMRYTSLLRSLLTGNEGVVGLRVEQLRVIGRTTGRGNFVRNLVLDFARFLDFKTVELNNRISDSANRTIGFVEQQTIIVFVLSLISISIFLIAVTIILRRVVGRLITLDTIVKSRLEGTHCDKKITGNDEISDIATTFDIFTSTIEEQKRALVELSLLDSLTGIANRRAMDERLLHELQMSARNQYTVSALLVDVDFFKLYNDTYGHAAGDECLKQVAQILKALMMRKTDFVARYGGEEFVCVLPNVDENGAEFVAKSIIQAMEEAKIPHKGSKIVDYLTVSIGIATTETDATLNADQLLSCADKALYCAKDKGRNGYFNYRCVKKMEPKS